MIVHWVQKRTIVETIIDYHQLSWPFERAFKLPIIHSQREIKEIFDPEKLTLAINLEHKST